MYAIALKDINNWDLTLRLKAIYTDVPNMLLLKFQIIKVWLKRIRVLRFRISVWQKNMQHEDQGRSPCWSSLRF